MKTTKYILVAMALLLGASYAHADTTIVKKFKLAKGGVMKWNGNSGINCDCSPNGEDCDIDIEIRISVTPAGPNLQVTGQALMGTIHVYMPFFQQPMPTVFNYNIGDAIFDILPGEFPGVLPQTVTVPLGIFTGPAGQVAFIAPNNP